MSCERLLDTDVTRAETWRDISAVLKSMQRGDDAILAVGPLLALGKANDLERTSALARVSRFSKALPEAFDTASFRGIDGRGSDPISELLAVVAEGMHKVHPAELDRYGLSSRDRLTSRSTHPMRMLADSVARVFGVQNYDLYIHSAHAGSLEVEFCDPPAIMVPGHVEQLRESEQIFLLARPMAKSRSGCSRRRAAQPSRARIPANSCRAGRRPNIRGRHG